MGTFAALCVSLAAGTAVAAEPDSVKPKWTERLYEMVKEWSSVDTAYVEPQHYNYSAMLQNTNTYEQYYLSDGKGLSVTLSPEMTVKVGPYFGWRWVFLGYTFDLSHIGDGNKDRDFNLSLYSNQVGIDLFYRNTGHNYKIRSMSLGEGVDTRPLRGVKFDGLRASVKGFNLYYIFNHKRFSYPAAFSQSTCQRRSQGSFLAGVGYTKHSLALDYTRLGETITRTLGPGVSVKGADSTLVSGKVEYTDLSVSGGYAYNWVFAHNWLAAASLSLAAGYKHATNDSRHRSFTLRDFSMENFNIDGVARLGIVWNNTKWYAGASAVFHSYNYSKDRFSANTVFGNINIYAGFNFSRR